FLLGNNPSYYSKRMAREVLGSSGVGNSGFSAIDLTPAGSALSAQESLQSGDVAGAGGYAASAAVPMGGLAMRSLMPAARPLARHGAGALAGMAAGVGTTEAATLNRAQRQQMEMERQRSEIDRQTAADRAKIEADSARQRAMDQAEAAARTKELD